jgi:ADP-heptose:LPS heptosyltransferase
MSTGPVSGRLRYCKDLWKIEKRLIQIFPFYGDFNFLHNRVKKRYFINNSLIKNSSYPIKITERLILYLIILDYNIKNSILRICVRCLFSPKLKNIRKILVIRNGSIGDSISAFPAIAKIREAFPDSQIDILNNSGPFVPLSEIINREIVNDVIEYKNISFSFIKLLFKKKYDLVIDLPQNLVTFSRLLRNIFVIRLLGYRHAFGWQISTTRLFKKYQEKYLYFPSEPNRLLNILNQNGIGVDNFQKNYLLKFSVAIESKISSLLNKMNLNVEKIVAVAIGANRPQNRWPIQYFREVVQYLSENDFTTIFIGGEADFNSASEIATYSNVHNFCGKLTVKESACILQKCLMTISNDSGPMHLSYAVGTPVVALFASRQHPGLWYPPEDARSIVHRNYNIPCSMCFSEATGRNTCNNNICMQGIKPLDVIRSIRKILVILNNDRVA